MPQVLKQYAEYEKYYRGYYSNFGIENILQSFIWISDDKNYANMYGDSLAIFNIPTLDYNLIADIYESEDLLKEFNEINNVDYDITDILYNPTEEFVSFLREQSYNGFMPKDNCICIINKKLLRLR